MRNVLTTNEILADLRISRRMKQKDIAEYLGIERNSYTSYESGARMPPPDKLIKLAQMYGVTVDYLLGREDKDLLSSVISTYQGRPVTLGSLYAKIRELDEEHINSIITFIDLLREGRYSVHIEENKKTSSK